MRKYKNSEKIWPILRDGLQKCIQKWAVKLTSYRNISDDRIFVFKSEFKIFVLFYENNFFSYKNKNEEIFVFLFYLT